MTEDKKGTKKKILDLTRDPIQTDDNFVVDDTSVPNTLDWEPSDEATLTKMHNQSDDASAPSELGSGSKTKRLPKGIKPGWPDD